MEDRAREFAEQRLGCHVETSRLAETIEYPDLAGDDRIYDIMTKNGRFWLVCDPSFGSEVYPHELFESADKVYLRHVALKAREMRRKRRPLSSVVEERAALQEGDSRRKTKMNNKPHKTIRSGLIRAVIWKNAPKNGSSDRDFFSVQVERLFKRDEASQWETTNSFGVNDLARVKLVVSEAFKLLALSPEHKPDNGAEPVEVEEVKVE